MPAESTYTTPTPDCPYPGLWTAPDAQASELEVGEFMFGLVRLLKPKLVLETGCYLGHTTVQLARAMKLNQLGHLHVCDLAEDKCQLVRDKLLQADLPGVVHQCSGLELVQKFDYVNLAFIDTDDDKTRFGEIQALRLAPQAFVALHDARRKVATITQLRMGWPQLFFPTPRGLSLYAAR